MSTCKTPRCRRTGGKTYRHQRTMEDCKIVNRELVNQ